MMENSELEQKLRTVKTFVLDIDGVLTDGTVTLFPGKEQVRSVHVKDGFAMRYAQEKGFKIVLISKGTSDTVIDGLSRLGVEEIFLRIDDKLAKLDEYVNSRSIRLEEVLYMGDDIPDYYAMKQCGVKACPKDAAAEIVSISDYVSDKKGGKGCVRDIIEQTLKIQNKWFLC